MKRHPVKSLRAAIASVTLALVATLALGVPSSSADDPVPDGATEATAAASCWEIKQNVPAAASGLYWLLTPELRYPQRFYCDQETDGGGWVLIARGREGWKTDYHGFRPEQVIANVSGPSAFVPAQLHSSTVDGLLNGGRVDALTDGIRIRRATDVGGTTWQEGRFQFAKRDRWAWTFGAEHRVSWYDLGTGRRTGGQTSNFGSNNNYARVNTQYVSSHNWAWGFAFGNDVTGNPASSSYLWTPNTGTGLARPFTQVYLRPTLETADLTFPVVPDGGSAASTNPDVAEWGAMATSWGVSGFGNGSGGELNTEVATFGEMNGVMYVGGNFRYVQRSQAGLDQVEQRFIAAFDLETGAWIPSFRPNLNGQVKAIVALPDGRLAVGGQFSTVNGVSQTALTFLDPVTGARSGWQPYIENRITGGTPYVRGADVQDGHLYLAGAFTHLRREGVSTAAYGLNGGRYNLGTGSPDVNWNAALNGTSVGVDVASDGTRVYLSGYFRQKGTTPSPSAVALQTVSGAPLTTPQWNAQFSSTGAYFQFDVAEAGESGRVYTGGSEHAIFGYDRSTFALTSGSITKAGGDFQAIEIGGGDSREVVYGGCHCGDWTYQDAYRWPDVGTSWNQADKIHLIGAWDAATGEYIPEFSVTLNARAGYGVWAAEQDSNGVLWAGGDLLTSVRSNGTSQWSGGFVRYNAADTVAPTRPSGLSASVVDGGVRLSWTGSTDDRGSVVYEVLREDRVIGSTSATNLVVPAESETTRYFVRARDTAGNLSASTARIVVEPPAEVETVVASGSAWRWRYSNDALPASWNQPGFDASSWANGPALLGVNAPGQQTNLNAASPSPRPLSAQFVRTVTISDPATVAAASISVVADDGVVVYVNGTEVGRSRMPSGTLTQNSYATAAVTTTSAIANPVRFDVPPGLLSAGANVIAASTHANYRSTPNLGFDLSMVVERGEAAPPPAAVTGLTGTAAGPSSIDLEWGAGAGTPPASYRVERDGSEVAVVEAPQTSFTDPDLTASTSYEYTVTAVDTFGRSSQPVSVTVATTAPEAPPGPVANLSAEAGSTSVTLSWTAGSGDPARYLVQRDGGAATEVQAPATTFVDDGLDPATEYTYEVVAVSASGLESSAASVSVTTTADPQVQLVPNGADWSWRFDNQAWPSGWNQPGFDASSWTVGSAVLGINAPGQQTDLNAGSPSPRPLSAQFVRTFEVSGAASLSDVTVTVVADDGVVVYVNGVEIGRERLPAGTLGQNSYATAAPSSASALANRVTFSVPAGVLVDGTNVIAASTHANWRSTPNLSFDLRVDATRAV